MYHHQKYEIYEKYSNDLTKHLKLKKTLTQIINLGIVFIAYVIHMKIIQKMMERYFDILLRCQYIPEIDRICNNQLVAYTYTLRREKEISCYILPGMIINMKDLYAQLIIL